MKRILLQNKLKGPIFSIITPFNKNEKIDYKFLKNYINYLYKRGARNFFVMVYNSRLGLLTKEEILKLNVFCIKIVKKLNKKNIIICAEPYQTSTEESIKYIRYFKSAGADIVSVIFGEKYYSDIQIYNHYKKLNDKGNMNLLLHQQLLESGISSNQPYKFYSLNLIKKISKLKNFVAMKEDAKDDSFTKKICKAISKNMIIITSGNGKKQWLKAAKFGCQSWLAGVSNVDPKIAIDFYDYYLKNDKKKINNIINYIEAPFNKIKDKFSWHLTIKSLLENEKIITRFERMPLRALDTTKYRALTKMFNNLKRRCKKKFLERYFRIK